MKASTVFNKIFGWSFEASPAVENVHRMVQRNPHWPGSVLNFRTFPVPLRPTPTGDIYVDVYDRK
jgi:hypothetical protein